MATAFRIASYPSAFWKLPNRSAGRFHALGDPATQYLALHPLTAWAETIRNAGFVRAEVVDAELRQRLWALQVDLEPLLELGFSAIGRHGLTPTDLVADDQSACRALGRKLRRQGHEGLIYPSSALPGTSCVCLFGERYESAYLATPIGRLDLPTAVAAEDARPLSSLLERVRLHGEPHTGLDAHGRSEDYRFDEPDVSLVAT